MTSPTTNETTATPAHGQVSNQVNEQDNNRSAIDKPNHQLSVALIGFSKGGVVLNQLIYSLASMISQGTVQKLGIKITHLYLLDTGHNGYSGFWVTDPSVIESLAKYASVIGGRPIQIAIGSTAFQLEYKRNPRMREEERKFRELVEKFSREKSNSKELLKLSRLYLDTSKMARKSANDYLTLHFSIIDSVVDGNL